MSWGFVGVRKGVLKVVWFELNEIRANTSLERFGKEGLSLNSEPCALCSHKGRDDHKEGQR